MKKFILLTLIAFATLTSSAQTYYKLHGSKTLKEAKMKAFAPNVQIHFNSIAYTQISLAASFNQITLKDGHFSESNSTISFTPSFMKAGANAVITVTSDGDTLYHTSQVLAYGAGINVSDNLVTGKAGIAPSIVLQAAQFAITCGYDLVNKAVVMGANFSLSDLPFVNYTTKIKVN